MKPYPRLGVSYFQSEDVEALAQDLLGKVLVTRFNGETTSGEIVETEAYKAPQDKASHAYGNRRTDRTEIMFGPGGYAYVYLCYGIHHLFNVVTGPSGSAHAVLIRALQPLFNIPLMQQRRKRESLGMLCSGPGTLTQAMGIFRHHTGLSLTDAASPIWIEDHMKVVKKPQIIASPRVGVDYAEECAAWPWRFRIKDNPFTSKAK